MSSTSTVRRIGFRVDRSKAPLLERIRPLVRYVPKDDALLLREVPITIEFVGHAGSGKTFLRDLLVKALREKYRVAQNPRVSTVDLLSFLFFCPRISFDLLRFVIFARPKSIKAASKALVKLLFYQIKRSKALRDGAEMLVFDEGMLHRLRMLRSTSRRATLSYAEINPQLRKRVFPRPDLIVFVVASLETTAKRKTARDEEKPGAEEADEMIRRKNRSFGASLKSTENDILTAQRDHGFRYLKLFNEEGSSPEVHVRRIVDEISFLGTTRPLVNRER